MNILNKLLLLLSLSMSPAVTVSAAAENADFDTFHTEAQYFADFNYLNESSYRWSYADYIDNGSYEATYDGGKFLFYVFPIYYDFNYETFVMEFYYSNENYFFLAFNDVYENDMIVEFSNYTGNEIEMPFLALDYVGMTQVIEHDKAEKSNSISIYNSFYNFFTGFFPNEVVNEYHGIFTFIVVGFLLFLVFGFVFFLFRVIRRLVGFK